MNPAFRALRCGSIVLHRITDERFDEVLDLFSGYPDTDVLHAELRRSYRPRYDDEGRCTKYGFYCLLDGVLAGASLLGISSWPDQRGYTGADMLLHMRGKGVAPGSKPHLFHLGFAMLGLNRIETGCYAFNTASKRSIEKTPGFVYEGTMRQYGYNPQGELDDEHRYAILRHDWLRLYDPNQVEVIP